MMTATTPAACEQSCCETAANAGTTGHLSGMNWLFDTTPFPARWNCGEWSEPLGYLHISSDLLTWGAYTAIPLVLAFYIRRRPDTPFPAVFWLFAAFIFSCGTVHLIEAIIFYEPIYRFSGVIKAITAGVSWLTVFALIPTVPRALELPGLAEVNRKLQAENQNRMRAEEALARRNEDLQYLLYVVSHDLREPVRAVTAFSDLLEQRFGSQLDARGREFIELIHDGGERLHRQLDDIATLARARSGVFETEPLAIRDVVDDVLRNVTERIRETDAIIRVSDDLPTVRANREWTTIAVQNLIANALKFTREGQRPRIEIEPYAPRADEPQQPGIVVRDHGIGIEPEQAERIFQLFHHGAGPGAGSGAGLAIVRQIAERHGGSVWARSGIDDGAALVITFGDSGTQPPADD